MPGYAMPIAVPANRRTHRSPRAGNGPQAVCSDSVPGGALPDAAQEVTASDKKHARRKWLSK